ncbi:MAG: DNA repair protein RadC [Candidatus Phytoplasma sp.]|nr:DNA repair protein RadC [Phytoplasma sp.]
MNHDKPRERLERLGVDALKTEELIAILLGTGNQDKNVYELSREILDQLNTLEDLKNMKLNELTLIKGVKKAKASKIIAAIELGKRLSFAKYQELKKLNRIEDVYYLLKDKMSHLEQEHFIVLFLNTKSEVIHQETVFIGTINQTVIHPREIFKQAIRLSASSIICVHNHPTGNSTPSQMDLVSTHSLIEASEILKISLIDHIIIGKNEFFSIRQNKKIKV